MLPDPFNDGPEPTGAQPQTHFATLYPTGGQAVFLPIDNLEAPPTIADAVVAAGLTVGQSTQYWVDGQQVNPLEFRIGDGMTITAVGNVKGG